VVKAYFEVYSQHAKEKGYLPMCFASDDEFLAHGGSIAQCTEYHRILKANAPGVRFAAFDSIYPEARPKDVPAWEKMLGQIDTWGAGEYTARTAELVTRAGSKLWIYNTGMNRFSFGTYLYFAHRDWKVQAFLQWVYPMFGTYTQFDLVGHNEGHYGVVYPSTRGLRTTPEWERIRAGCDDQRYLQTASECIARARSTGRGVKEADALQKTIDATLAKLTFGKAGGEGADDPSRPARMEEFRRNVAEGILAVQKAME
jgi:hypothetical protein